MKLLFTLLISLALGWLTGKHLGSSQKSTDIPQALEEKKASTPPPLVSSDSLVSFSTESQLIPIERLALWLLDAEPSEIALLFDDLTSRPNQDKIAINFLINAWARQDPVAAIEATKDTDFHLDSWEAFARHHPDRSFQRAQELLHKADDHDPFHTVIASLAKHHPSWIQTHLDDLPSDHFKQVALRNYQPDLHADNPQESIDFLQKNGMRIKSELLVSLGKKNPVKALQLIEELQLRHRNQYNDQIKKLAEALADEDPSLLDVLLAATNSPKTKEMIELIKFQRVLEWDPEAAAYLLRDLPESYSKQDKMAAMSRHFLKSDPQKSVEIFSQLLAQSSRGLQRGTDIISEHNYSTYYKTSPPQMLLEDFIITQPETLINATLPREGDSTRTHLNLP